MTSPVKIIQLHPTKTGGRALASILKSYKDGYIYCNHTTLDKIISSHGINNFFSYHSIMMCRNPYSRIHSLHRFYSMYPDWGIRNKYGCSFLDFILKFKKELHKICIPQYKYCVYEDVLVIDFIGSFENYAIELTYHLSDLNISKKIQQNHIRNWKNDFNKQIQDIVYEVYEEDFLRLGYDYEIK